MITTTSPETTAYNCIAWAAGDIRRWWWPDPFFLYYWPPGIPRQETTDAFIALYESLGYEVCQNSDYEDGYEKIALYVSGLGKPTHAARQLPNGSWTSKLGRSFDVEHDLPEEVARLGSNPLFHYGIVAVVLRRPRL